MSIGGRGVVGRGSAWGISSQGGRDGTGPILLRGLRRGANLGGGPLDGPVGLLGGRPRGGTGRKGGVARSGRGRTTPGVARPWGFPTPGVAGPGRTPGPGGRRPVVCRLGLATGAGWASGGASCWSATGVCTSIRSWDSSISPADGGHSGGPGSGAPSTPLAGAGLLGSGQGGGWGPARPHLAGAGGAGCLGHPRRWS